MSEKQTIEAGNSLPPPLKAKTTTLGPFVRLGRDLEYTLVIQRGKGRNAEFIAGVRFAGKPTRRELRQWRDAIQRGIEPNMAHLEAGGWSEGDGGK